MPIRVRARVSDTGLEIVRALAVVNSELKSQGGLIPVLFFSHYYYDCYYEG